MIRSFPEKRKALKAKTRSKSVKKKVPKRKPKQSKVLRDYSEEAPRITRFSPD